MSQSQRENEDVSRIEEPIVEEAALILHQERCVAFDATRLFSRRVILR